MRKILTAIAAFLLPSVLARLILNMMGHRLHHSAKIGFSFLWCDNIIMQNDASIGHFNFINVSEIEMGQHSAIGARNKMNGPFNIVMKEHARISTSNGIARAKFPVTYGDAYLMLGAYAIITHAHRIDLTRSVTFGDYSILAGAESQLWTHGYYHAAAGLDRIRIDGAIRIGNNVYIGSRCIFNPGVNVADAIHVGTGCCVSKDLEDEGMYVSQPLRYINRRFNDVKSRLSPVEIEGLADTVYTKDGTRLQG